jgi:hypothetical protein
MVFYSFFFISLTLNKTFSRASNTMDSAGDTKEGEPEEDWEDDEPGEDWGDMELTVPTDSRFFPETKHDINERSKDVLANATISEERKVAEDREVAIALHTSDEKQRSHSNAEGRLRCSEFLSKIRYDNTCAVLAELENVKNVKIQAGVIN